MSGLHEAAKIEKELALEHTKTLGKIECLEAEVAFAKFEAHHFASKARFFEESGRLVCAHLEQELERLRNGGNEERKTAEDVGVSVDGGAKVPDEVETSDAAELGRQCREIANLKEQIALQGDMIAHREEELLAAERKLCEVSLSKAAAKSRRENCDGESSPNDARGKGAGKDGRGRGKKEERRETGRKQPTGVPFWQNWTAPTFWSATSEAATPAKFSPLGRETALRSPEPNGTDETMENTHVAIS